MTLRRIINYLIGIACIVLGLLFIFSPNNMLSTIIYITGYLLTIFGLVYLVSGLIGKPILGSNKFFSSYFDIGLGLLLVLLKDKALDIIPYIIGVYLIITGIYSIIINIFINRRSSKYLLSDVFLIIMGLVLIFTPIIKFSIALIIGIMLIIVGIYIIFSYKEASIYRVRVK